MTDVIESAERGLKGHVGPVPVWAIGVGVGAVAIGGYVIYSRRNAATISAANTAPVGTDTTGIVDPTYSTAGYNTANDSGAVDTSAADSAAADAAALAAQQASDQQAAQAAAQQAQLQAQQDAFEQARQVQADRMNVLAESARQQQQAAAQRAANQLQQQQQAFQERLAAQQQASATVVKVTNPTPVAAAPKPAAPKPAAPKDTAAKYSIDTQPLGTDYTMLSPHNRYKSAADANAKKNSNGTVNPGKYVLVNRQKLSSGYVVLVAPKSGGTQGWINV